MGIKQSNFECINYSNTTSLYFLENVNSDHYIDCSQRMGYANKSIFLFSLLSILGILINIYLIFHFFKQKIKGHDTKTTLKKMFILTSFIEIILSVYWLVNRFAFTDGYKIRNNKGGCHAMSIIYIIIFTFNFTFVDFILYHFIQINNDPIEGILKSKTNLIKYLIICTGFSIVEGILCLSLGIIGKSVSYINN